MVKAVIRRLLPTLLWVQLRRLRRRYELRTFDRRDVRHSYCGVDLTVRLTDPIAEAWYDQDWQRLPEIDLLRRGRLRPGARVLNLGAHQAVVALLLLRSVEPHGSVIAVEATAHNVEIAEANARLNGADNLRVLHAAASNTTEPVRFADYFDGFIDERHGSSLVEGVTVDSLAERYGRPDVVFMDIEGAEVRALEGARDTLAGRACDWYVEIHVGFGLERLGGSRAEVFAAFPLDAYDVYVAFEQRGEYQPYKGEDELQRSAHALVALARAL